MNIMTKKGASASLFSSICWHDCELLRLEFVQIYSERKVEIVIDANPVRRLPTGERLREKVRIVFENCDFFSASMDLPYLLSSKLSIDGAWVIEDLQDVQNDFVIKVLRKYRDQQSHILKRGRCFVFEMMEPGGEILIQAENFRVIDFNVP